MTKISLYSNDTVINPGDRVIGSDAADQDKTKNFTIASLQTYFGSDAVFTKEVVLDNDDILNLGTPKVLVEVPEGGYAEILSVSVEIVNNGDGLGSSYTWADAIIIGWTGDTDDNHYAAIPIDKCPLGSLGAKQEPYICVPNQGTWRGSSDVSIFEKNGEDPTASDNPSSEMTVRITYRLYGG